MKQVFTLEEVFKGCRRNQSDAQHRLYNLLAPKMLALCMRYAKDRQEAEDMLQIGFLKIFRKAGSFRNEGSVEGWIKRIMVNTAIEVYRKSQRMLKVVDSGELCDLPQQTFDDNKLETKDLLRLIQQLPGLYKLVFNLYVIEGYSHKEIAKTLNISENNSKSQLHRARAILKEKISKLENTDYATSIG